MPVQRILMRVFECDKCHHLWTPKKTNILEKALNDKELEDFQNKHRPKKCPKCNSPDWDYKHIILPKDHKTSNKALELIKKKYGQNAYELIKGKQDKEFHKKVVLRDIENQKKELERFKKQREMIDTVIKSGEGLLKDFEKELKSI